MERKISVDFLPGRDSIYLIYSILWGREILCKRVYIEDCMIKIYWNFLVSGDSFIDTFEINDTIEHVGYSFLGRRRDES